MKHIGGVLLRSSYGVPFEYHRHERWKRVAGHVERASLTATGGPEGNSTQSSADVV